MRSYKYRIRPSSAQAKALDAMLEDFCGLYNACLQQRQEAYKRSGLTLRYARQASELKDVRAADPEGLGRWSFSALQQVLRRVDQTFSSFFKRRRGFPRFRSASRYHAATFRVGDGLTLKKNRRIGIVGVPGPIKVVWHREIPEGAQLGSVVLTRRSGKWFVIFSVEAEFAEACGEESVGVDLGLRSLIATSGGSVVDAPRFGQKAKASQRRLHRALSRCRKGSRRRSKVKERLAAGAAKIARQRRDFAHKTSRALVSANKQIAFENLNIAGIKRGMLALPVHDAAWSMLVQFTTYKAASAGASVVMVDPSGTSQTCPECGIIKAKMLAERTHRCDCGCTLDRDVAAAMVVRARAFGHGTCPRTPSQRVAA